MSTENLGANFIIPTGDTKAKNENLKILEAGPNPGILYSIIDLGTTFNNYYNKSVHNIKLIYEFPLLKQLFREGDTEERPTVVSQTYSFTISEGSNLKKKIIDGYEGRILQQSDYNKGWNIAQYLDRVCIVNIVNKPSKKDPSKIYNNIDTVQGLTESLRNRYNFNWDGIKRTNDLVLFSIDPNGECFKSQAFANLPKYYQDEIKKSDEAIAYANAGGTFAQRDAFNSGNTTPNPTTRPAPSIPKTSTTTEGFKMLVDDFTYEEYKKAGWTDEQLLEHNKMEKLIVKEPTKPEMPKGPNTIIEKEFNIEDSLDDVEGDSFI